MNHWPEPHRWEYAAEVGLLERRPAPSADSLQHHIVAAKGSDQGFHPREATVFHAPDDRLGFLALQAGFCSLAPMVKNGQCLDMGDDDAIARFGDTSNAAIGQRMRAIREASTPIPSQTAFAERVGAKKPSVQAWENGRQQPQVGHMAAACRLYGVTTDFILLGDWRRLSAEKWSAIRAAILEASEKSGERRAG